MRPGFLRGRGPAARRLWAAALRLHAAQRKRRAGEVGLRPALAEADRLPEVKMVKIPTENPWWMCIAHLTDENHYHIGIVENPRKIPRKILENLIFAGKIHSGKILWENLGKAGKILWENPWFDDHPLISPWVGLVGKIVVLESMVLQCLIAGE